MNKIVQVLGGFVFIALAIGVIAMIAISSTAKDTEVGQTSLDIADTSGVFNDALIAKLKSLKIVSNIPVTVSPGEVSRDNPFASY